MGDRVSIKFINSKESPIIGNRAPVIFSHWGGLYFVERAIKYCEDLVDERKGTLEPLDRLEPRTVTCDFIYNLDKYYPYIVNPAHRISHDIYIGIDEFDGDNGDNGHFNIDLGDSELVRRLRASITNALYRES